MAGLFGLRGLRRADRHERAGVALYAAAVAAARDPWFYQALGVPDTLDGRFDLVALHAFLLIHRLQDAADPGPPWPRRCSMPCSATWTRTCARSA